jgi:hypothetical protein
MKALSSRNNSPNGLKHLFDNYFRMPSKTKIQRPLIKDNNNALLLLDSYNGGLASNRNQSSNSNLNVYIRPMTLVSEAESLRNKYLVKILTKIKNLHRKKERKRKKMVKKIKLKIKESEE